MRMMISLCHHWISKSDSQERKGTYRQVVLFLSQSKTFTVRTNGSDDCGATGYTEACDQLAKSY